MQCCPVLEPEMPIKDITPFDMWLNQSLSVAFGDALQDPLPEEMLALLTARPDNDN